MAKPRPRPAAVKRPLSIASAVAASLTVVALAAHGTWHLVEASGAADYARPGAIVVAGLTVVAARQSGTRRARVLALYGASILGGALAWGAAFWGYRPDPADIVAAVTSLIGVAGLLTVCGPFSPRP